ncbi:MAG: trypsin-like peptidase domain-containing protein [Acidobacteria bacterium]|nr:trypsin-like peptidase domain-containing protein [Acidobacteriota bacterium]
MKFTIVHLSGSQRGKAQNFDIDSIKIGSDPSNEVAFDPKLDRAVSAQQAELRFDKDTCDFILVDKGSESGTFVNNRQISEIILQDGDLIELGQKGPKVRFKVQPEAQWMCKPFRQILFDSKEIAAQAQRGKLVTSTLFFKEMVRQAATESTRTVKVTTAVMAAVLLGVVGLLGYEIYLGKKEKKGYEQKITILSMSIEAERLSRRDLEKKLLEERQKLNLLSQGQAQMIADLRQELKQKEKELRFGFSESRETDLMEVKALRAKIKVLEREKSSAQDTIRKYGGGVCFIQGSYEFVEKASGKSLRYQGLDAKDEPLKDKEGNVLLTLAGSGPVITVNYTGTGFLVSRSGAILTNRHIVEPWSDSRPAQHLKTIEIEPKLKLLRAFFPNVKQPFGLTVAKVSDKADVALLKIDLNGFSLPVIKLDHSGRGAVVGQPVVLLGYPTGFDALLARADEKTSDEILEITGAESNKLALELAQRGLIRPLTTQGHLSDILLNQIIYDAQTTAGGSGGPLFNSKQEVIAINYAVLKEFSGSNFGVPIKFGIELLK